MSPVLRPRVRGAGAAWRGAEPQRFADDQETSIPFAAQAVAHGAEDLTRSVYDILEGVLIGDTATDWRSRASECPAVPPNTEILLDTSVVLAYLSASEAASPAATMVIDDFVRTGRTARRSAW